MPSWASEMTSLTPRRPRRARLRRKSIQGLGLGRADRHAEHLAPAVAVDADGDGDRNRDDAAVLADLEVGGVDPDIGLVALDRAVEKSLHPDIDLLAQPAHLALGDAPHALGFDQVVDRARRDPLNVGLLHDRSQRFLGQPPGLEEAGKVAALPELGDAQLDRAGPCLSVAIAVAVALGEPLGISSHRRPAPVSR